MLAFVLLRQMESQPSTVVVIRPFLPEEGHEEGERKVRGDTFLRLHRVGVRMLNVRSMGGNGTMKRKNIG